MKLSYEKGWLRIELEQEDKEELEKAGNDCGLALRDLLYDKGLDCDHFWYGSPEYLYDEKSDRYFGSYNQYIDFLAVLRRDGVIDLKEYGEFIWCQECGYLPKDGVPGDHHRDCDSYKLVCEDCQLFPHVGVPNEYNMALCEGCLTNRRKEN